MKRKIINLLLIILISVTPIIGIATPVLALGTTYYVSPTGNDGNTGLGMTDGTAWLTPQHASDTVVAGDTVNFLAGTYTNTTVWTFANSGSAVGGYITYQNYLTDSVTIQLSALWWANLTTESIDYLKFSGLNFIGDADTNGYGLYLWKSDHITVEDCLIEHCQNTGIYAQESTNITIDNCEINDCCISGFEENISIVTCDGFEVKNCHVHHPGANQKIGICLKVSSQNGSVHDNHIHDLPGWWPDGIYVDARQDEGLADTHNIQIYNNLIHDIPLGDGITVNDETGTTSPSTVYDIQIYNNIIYDVGYSGFSLGGGTTGETTYTDIWFINNTLYNVSAGNSREISLSTALPAYVTDCIVRNNIIYSVTNNSNPIYDPNDCYDGGQLIAEYNLWYNSGGVWSLADSTLGDDYVEGDPLFISVGSNFQIPVGSPAKDAGSATNAPADDYDGVTRPQNVLFDIGAYEYEIPPVLLPSVPLAGILPIVFIAAAVLLILNMISNGKPDIKSIVIIAILIYLALAVLPSIQTQINNL